MGAGEVAAALEESRALGREYVAAPGPLGQLGREVLLLRDALETVVALADTWSAEPVPASSHAGSVRAANVLRACGSSLQEAISSALGSPAPALGEAQGGPR